MRRPRSRLAHSATSAASVASALTASLPTTTFSPSRKITLGVILSPSALISVTGLPESSSLETAENVVPRSMPTAGCRDLAMVAIEAANNKSCHYRQHIRLLRFVGERNHQLLAQSVGQPIEGGYGRVSIFKILQAADCGSTHSRPFFKG